MKKAFILLFSIFFAGNAFAQSSGKKDAAYVIITKVVADHKMNDEEYLQDIQSLRQDERFNRKLNEMLTEMSNDGNSSKDKRVLKILRDAGRDIDRVLQVL